MKILVPIKRVPDYETKVKIQADGVSVVTDGIKWIVNPFDEIAVEEALRIKEGREGVEVIVVSVGPSTVVEQLRSALAMGADRAVLVVSDGVIDSDVAHRVLVEMVKREEPALVIMGKQAIDSDANQTGQLLAASLDLPQATFASKIVLTAAADSAEVTREIDGGLETIRVTLPAVITTDLRLNEPRYPSLPGIVKAKKKPLEEIPLSSLVPDAAPKTKIRKLAMPPTRKAGAKVQSVEELVSKLQNEAKVL